jgi:hypothetical protein
LTPPPDCGPLQMLCDPGRASGEARSERRSVGGTPPEYTASARVQACVHWNQRAG